MATLKGQGAHKAVSLIGVIKGGNDKGTYIDFQVDQSLKNITKVKSGASQAQTNPHISSFPTTAPDGTQIVGHDEFYQKSQVDKMLEVAKVVELEDGTKFIGIQADVMPKSGKAGETRKLDKLIVDTSKPMNKTQNPQFGKNTLERQNKVREAAKAFAEKSKADRTKAITNEVEAPAVEAEAQVETPEV